MKEIVLSSRSKDDFLELLRAHDSIQYRQKLAIIIDGPTLTYALEDEKLQQEFFNFGLRANSVICCRVSPK
jgi:magnesium-transporting ATPase (P-type)